jgi:hypothetical protein
MRLRHLTDPGRRGVRVFAVCPGLQQADAAILGVRLAASIPEALTLAGCREDAPGVYRVLDAGNTCVCVRAADDSGRCGPHA